VVETPVEEVVEAWVSELGDQVSVSATTLQDFLLDLWGLLADGPPRAGLERWLTETVGRNLYTTADITERLGRLFGIETVG